MSAFVWDGRKCELGEGPFWHPQRQQLFWFDILQCRLLSRTNNEQLEWCFDEMHSAAGWIDQCTLLLASETGLWSFDIEGGTRDLIVEIEAHNPLTRSNDGRADPFGGFWIGTMGKNAEAEMGSIWRWYKGELKRLYSNITIPNAICFTPCGQFAHFSDTVKRQVMRVSLNDAGWPKGEPEIFLDLTKHDLNPDGAVIDADGTLWVALWGASKVAAFDPRGKLVGEVPVGTPNVSCPAFGGENLNQLFLTTQPVYRLAGRREVRPI
jgi:sugar lactone lactonase YvrE